MFFLSYVSLKWRWILSLDTIFDLLNFSIPSHYFLFLGNNQFFYLISSWIFDKKRIAFPILKNYHRPSPYHIEKPFILQVKLSEKEKCNWTFIESSLFLFFPQSTNVFLVTGGKSVSSDSHRLVKEKKPFKNNAFVLLDTSRRWRYVWRDDILRYE